MSIALPHQTAVVTRQENSNLVREVR
jgi:hypothetical protein